MIRIIISLFFIASSSYVSAQSNEASTDSIHRYVDILPRAGYNFDKYLVANLRYPEAAKENNIEGRVNVQFVVNEDGAITNAKVVGSKRTGAGCEEEAVRLISAMPKWIPAKLNEKSVKAYYTQPVIFRLEDDKH
jgi:protein TonB